MASEKDRVVAQLITNLEQASRLRAHATATPGELAARMHLRQWQADRLSRSYGDLLQSPRFGQAANFFLSDLYGPKDFSARDADLARLVPLMTKMLPLAGLQTVCRTIELDALSERLDGEMAAELKQRGVRNIDGDRYAAAYRRVGDRPGRERQIELIIDVGGALDRLTHMPLIGGMLHLMREPAHLAGMGAIQAFMERGFDSFRQMGSATEFLETIRSRETQMLQDLFAGRMPDCLLAVSSGKG